MTLIKKILNELLKIKFFSNIFKSIRGNFVILYYHGVLEDSEFNKFNGPNKDLFIPKSNFIKQMNYLKQNNIDVISMDELYKSNFSPLNFSVIISFDDGYKDNLEVVHPILKKKKFPFIIYLIPNLLKEDPWVWWIELWDQLQKKNIIIFDNNKINISNENLKIEAFLAIKKKIKKLRSKDQKKMIKKMFNLTKTTNMSKYFLNETDIKSLLKDKLVTIGSHSQDHLSLKKFNKKIVLKQIKKSKIYLEKCFEIPIEHFSYPYGQKDDIAFYEHEILSDCKFLTSVTTMDYSHKSFNSYYLNRCSIGPNVSENDFHRKLLGVDKFLRKIFFQ